MGVEHGVGACAGGGLGGFILADAGAFPVGEEGVLFFLAGLVVAADGGDGGGGGEDAEGEGFSFIGLHDCSWFTFTCYWRSILYSVLHHAGLHQPDDHGSCEDDKRGGEDE